MASKKRNPRTITDIIGRVVYVDEEQGFGFAELMTFGHHDQLAGLGRSVYFRLNRCLTVTGTADEPRLTAKPASHVTLVAQHRPNRYNYSDPSQVVMSVRYTPQGLQATAWGIIP